MSEQMNAIEEIIRQAQEKGDFANLPGQGRPLPLPENPFAADSQLAHSLLQNNGFTLPWIADKRELSAELDGWRQKLSVAWQQRSRGPAWERHWHDSAAAFRDEAEKLNRRILTYNLKVPAASQQLLPINVETELARAQQSLARARQSLARAQQSLPPTAEPAPSTTELPTAAPTPSWRQRALNHIRSLKHSLNRPSAD
jgi:hypothetical protein